MAALIFPPSPLLGQRFPADPGISGIGQWEWDGSKWDAVLPITMTVLSLFESFDGVNPSFTLVVAGTSSPFSPVPDTNIVVFLGGVPQTPGVSYSVSGSTITFTEPPAIGSVFYAFSNTGG